MYERKEIAVSGNAYKFYQVLLLLFPASYRKKFGQEMFILFEDIYQEELQKNGKLNLFFWLILIFDNLKGAFEQHSHLAKKLGMKKYMKNTLHISTYNIIGGLLLVPFFTLFMIDLLARIWQGDLLHYNRPVYSYLSHTPLYWYPVLFSIAIIFPALAVLINSIPLVENTIRKHGSPFRISFVRQNLITLFLLLIGLGFLAIIKFHDFVPCVFHGLLKIGIAHLSHIIPVCRNA